MPKLKDRNSHAASAVVSQRISCGYMDTDNVPIVKLTSSLAVVVRLVSDGRHCVMKHPIFGFFKIAGLNIFLLSVFCFFIWLYGISESGIVSLAIGTV